MRKPDRLRRPATTADSPPERAPAALRPPVDLLGEYWTDVAQRSVLLLDILRERANNMLAH